MEAAMHEDIPAQIKNGPVQRLSLTAVNSDSETKTNGKLYTLDVRPHLAMSRMKLLYEESNEQQFTVLQSRNLQSVRHDGCNRNFGPIG